MVRNWELVYNQRNCFRFRYTQFNATTVTLDNGTELTEYLQTGSLCSFKGGDFLDLQAFALFRWISFGIYLTLGAVCMYRYWQFWKTTPPQKRLNSIPLAMLLRLSVLDIFAVLYFQDTNVLEIYPIWFRSFLVFINNFFILSILIVLLYQVWASLLSDLNQPISTKFVTERKAYITFGQLSVACAFYSIYFKNPLLSAIQWMIIAIEMLVLFIFNFWFGLKVIREIHNVRAGLRENVKHQARTASKGKILRKILTLTFILAAAVVVGFVYYTIVSLTLFQRWASDTQVYVKKEQIVFGSWSALMTVWLATFLTNLSGITVFKKHIDKSEAGRAPSGSLKRTRSLSAMRKNSNSVAGAAPPDGVLPVPETDVPTGAGAHTEMVQSKSKRGSLSLPSNVA